MSNDDEVSWDFFLAHASTDTSIAEELFDQLINWHSFVARLHEEEQRERWDETRFFLREGIHRPPKPRKPRGFEFFNPYHAPVRVFLDTRSLRLGDDWDTATLDAQRRSRITVVLVTAAAQRTYYQREEVAAAVAMARQDANKHRVVPLFIGDATSLQIPYGLRIKHGLHIAGPHDLPRAASYLLELLADLDALPNQVLVSRATMIECSSEADEEVSLKTLTRSTSHAVTAIHKFIEAIEAVARSGVRTVDFIADRRERSRLRALLRELWMIQISQTPLPWLLRLAAKETRMELSDVPVDPNTGARSSRLPWSQVTETIASLTPVVAKATELLATANGPFMLSATQAYKSLLFSLKGRQHIYAKLNALPEPTTLEEVEQLEALATQYELMVDEIARAEEAITSYLGGPNTLWGNDG